MWRNISITSKMLVASIATLSAVLVVGIAIIGWQSSAVTHEVSMREAKAVAGKQASEVRSALEYGLISAQNMTYALDAMKSNGITDRSAWTGILRKTLDENTRLTGTWGIVVEDALDGNNASHVATEFHDKSGEWRPYFFRKPDGSIGFRTLANLAKNNYQDAWFRGAYDGGKPFVTEPYSWEMGGKTVSGVSLAVPIKGTDGKPIGVAGTDIVLTQISESLGKITPLGSGSVHLLSPAGKWVAHADSTLLGKEWAEGRATEDLEYQSTLLAAVKDGKPLTYRGYSNTLGTEVMRIVEPVAVGDTGYTMALVVNVPTDTLSAASVNITLTVVGIGVALVLAVAIALFFVGRSVIRTPLEATIASINALVNRQYDAKLSYLDRHDEIGQINQALEVFREKSQSAERLSAQQKEEQAEQIRRAQRINELAQDFDTQVSGLLDIVANSVVTLNQTSASLTEGADSTSERSNAVAAASEEASSNVETVASAAEELFSSVNEIDRQVNQSNQIAANAVTQARRTNDKIEGLSTAASRIGEVVKLITDIAEQTNLLALNATIEAARAGESGRGFAVVAAEVKELANQTSKATDDISQQIQAVQAETDGAVAAIKDITSTIEQMNEIATSISEAVQQQGMATQEIARNIQEASAGTREVSSNIVGVSQAAGETGVSARQVSQSALELQQESNNLKGRVHSFLSEVRAIVG